MNIKTNALKHLIAGTFLIKWSFSFIIKALSRYSIVFVEEALLDWLHDVAHNILATNTKQPPTRDNLSIAQFKPPPSQLNTLLKKVFKELLVNYSVFIK